MVITAEVTAPRIRAARLRQGWDQRKLESESGVSQSTLSRIESGKRVPSMPEILQLAAALGTSLGSLTGQSPVRERLVFAARTQDDQAAEALKDRLAFYLEMDAQFEALGYASQA